MHHSWLIVCVIFIANRVFQHYNKISSLSQEAINVYYPIVNVFFNLIFWVNFYTLVLNIDFNEDFGYYNDPCLDVVDGKIAFVTKFFRIFYIVDLVWVIRKRRHSFFGIVVDSFLIFDKDLVNFRFSDSEFNDDKEDHYFFNHLISVFVTLRNHCCRNSDNFLGFQNVVLICIIFHTLSWRRCDRECTID